MNYKGIILSTLVLLAVSNFVFGQQDSKTFFIATNGIDSNSGTIDSPFASLERSRNAISELKTKNAFPRNGVTVYVSGIYQLMTGERAWGRLNQGTKNYGENGAEVSIQSSKWKGKQQI